MSSVKIWPRRPGSLVPSPLPNVIQTPSGLALLELQGTINMPQLELDDDGKAVEDVEVGKIDFPDYQTDAVGTAWMKRVYMYVGQHQRLTGEVKKLPRVVAVVKKRSSGTDDQTEDLEVMDIIQYKVVFSQRPEPVSTA